MLYVSWLISKCRAHFCVSAGRQGGWGAGRLLAFTEWRKLNLYPLLYQGVWASRRPSGWIGRVSHPSPQSPCWKEKKTVGSRAHTWHVTVYRDLAAVGNESHNTYNQESCHIHQKPRITLPSNPLILLLETYPKKNNFRYKKSKIFVRRLKKNYKYISKPSVIQERFS